MRYITVLFFCCVVMYASGLPLKGKDRFDEKDIIYDLEDLFTEKKEETIRVHHVPLRKRVLVKTYPEVKEGQHSSPVEYEFDLLKSEDSEPMRVRY